MSILFTPDKKGAIPSIGGKARNLVQLNKMDFRIPKWAVLSENVLIDLLPKDVSVQKIDQEVTQLEFPDKIMTEIANYFGEDATKLSYAVRSSASDEDGSDFSFAGQFETFLHVPFNDIPNKVKEIWKSVGSNRVMKYREENQLDMKIGISVIIQEMVDGETSGVAFGINPTNGNADEKIISTVFGLGEGLVSGELNADTFILNQDKIESQLALKTHRIARSQNGSGIEKIDIESEKQNSPSLDDVKIHEIGRILDKLGKHYGCPQDIEFTYRNDDLYILQCRPITAIQKNSEEEYILWDNSNIIESYPGITTPLTFSFIIKMYEMVYRQFVQLMGVKEKEIEKHKEVFANTLGLVRGRVYYNLLSWYKMLAMLPGYSINAEFMENMMGVKERFELKEDYQMSKGMAKWRIFTLIFRMIYIFLRLPSERKRFMKHLEKVMSEYSSMKFKEMSIPQIVEQYNRYEESLLLKWKAPLINDFFAMIWFGILQKQVEKLCPEDKNLHNDLLCGSQDIISVEPIHMSLEIAGLIEQDKSLKEQFLNLESAFLWEGIQKEGPQNVKNLINEYLEKYGDRCIGELKLESVSYKQEPERFIKLIQSYVRQGISQSTTSSNLEDEIRVKAEEKIMEKLKRKPVKNWLFRLILKKTRDLVSNRENLRYERTRGFGMVRKMFSVIGEKLKIEGYLDDARDIFYLELNEIKTFRENIPELKSRIEKRKSEFANYQSQEVPKERFYTYGYNFTDEFIYSDKKMDELSGDLSGIGCCPGVVKNKVRVIHNPEEIESLEGDILVTSSTDPGWVTLFPTTSAILVERGSLLSHSAIVSREMGIPCIVGITGLLRTLKTGDEVLMNGSTGTIEIIKN